MVYTPVQPRIAHGGDHVQGVKLGIVMVPSTAPKILGDLAHAGTWRFPVRFRCADTVPDTTQGIFDTLVAQAQDLVDEGCRAIATNYRFLSAYQTDFATAIKVPCITSVLYQYRMVRAVIPPHKTIAIMTTDTNILDMHMLQSLDIPLHTPIITLDTAGGDTQQAISHVVQATQHMCTHYTDIGAVLMESNDLSAYSHTVYQQTGIPVYDVYALIDWFGNSLQPQNFGIPYMYEE